LEITFGIRYDETQAKFRGVDQPRSGLLGTPSLDGTPIPSQYLGDPFVPNEKRIFKRTSPRVGFVYFVSNNLTLKLMSGKAFREPSITELFGFNTFSLASNPRKLKPEVIHTTEVGVDWLINKYINIRGNLFRTRYENQIAYSVANNNLSTNLYTLTTGGAEGEALFTYKNLSGFLNFSYAKRLNEFIQDRTISIDKNQITWVPSHTANLGITWTDQKFMTSISFERQGSVYRRNSDLGPVDPIFGFNTNLPPYEYNYPVYRPKVVPAWINVNYRFMYKWNESVEMGIEKDMLEKMIKRLNGKIFYIDGWVYIKNFEKHNYARGHSKVKIGVENAKKEIPKHILDKIAEISENQIRRIQFGKKKKPAGKKTRNE